MHGVMVSAGTYGDVVTIRVDTEGAEYIATLMEAQDDAGAREIAGSIRMAIENA